MTDKKSPDDPAANWKASPTDDQHTRTYSIKGSAESAPSEPEPAGTGSPEPAPVPEPAPAPKSQAVLDIQEAGLTPEEAMAASLELSEKAAAEEAKADRKAAQKGDDRRSGVENLAVIARFRWLVLLILSWVSILIWAVEAEYAGRPFHWEAWGLVAVTAILTLPFPGGKFLRLPTRGGLAALFWSMAFFISALFGPPELFFKTVPAALAWGGVLTLIMLWEGVAIWRKVGRYKVVDIILALILIYAALSPLWALVDNIMAGGALNLKFSVLGASPDFLTSRLPWFLWPMTVTVAVILPLAALFSLWDQFSAFRRRGARHGGNFFLALAFIGLIPYGFLSFQQAVAEEPGWASTIRSVYPKAATWARENLAPSPDEDWTVIEAPAEEPVPVPEPEAAPAEPAPVEEPAPAPEPAPQMTPPPTEAPAPAPQAVTPPAETPASQAPSPVVPAPGPTAEERLQATEQRLAATEKRLAEALDRVEALERKLRDLTYRLDYPANPIPEPTPPSDVPGQVGPTLMEQLRSVPHSST